MHILDREKLKTIARQRGFKNFSDLSDQLGLHRNTLQHYLAGRAVFPKSLENLFTRLQISPGEVLKKKPPEQGAYSLRIAQLTDQLHEKFPHLTFILFGSRARGTAQRYSDFDIGIYADKKITHADFVRFRSVANDLVEPLPFSVDWVNLTIAPQDFLMNIARDWRYLTGRQTDWLKLQEETNA